MTNEPSVLESDAIKINVRLKKWTNIIYVINIIEIFIALLNYTYFHLNNIDDEQIQFGLFVLYSITGFPFLLGYVSGPLGVVLSIFSFKKHKTYKILILIIISLFIIWFWYFYFLKVQA